MGLGFFAALLPRLQSLLDAGDAGFGRLQGRLRVFQADVQALGRLQDGDFGAHGGEVGLDVGELLQGRLVAGDLGPRLGREQALLESLGRFLGHGAQIWEGRQSRLALQQVLIHLGQPRPVFARRLGFGF